MAMFEAIHGSAPDIAGKNIANPSGLLNAAIQMLIHINQPEVATLIENAWLKTLEDGIHTGDIYSSALAKKKSATAGFADAVIARLGEKPTHLKPVHYKPGAYAKIMCFGGKKKNPSRKTLVGVDLFIDNIDEMDAETLAQKINTLNSPLKLIAITSRGLKIWPHSTIDTPYLNDCCCRFQSALVIDDLLEVKHQDINQLLGLFNELKLDVVKTENLYLFDGTLGFSLAQGQ